MKQMVIKGSVWHRGGSYQMRGDHGGLLTKRGRRCCMGIHAQFCGIHDDHLLNRGMPSAVSQVEITECFMPWISDVGIRPGGPRNSRLAMQAVSINDREDTTDDEKIKQLRPIFEEIGIEIVWEPES